MNWNIFTLYEINRSAKKLFLFIQFMAWKITVLGALGVWLEFSISALISVDLGWIFKEPCYMNTHISSKLLLIIQFQIVKQLLRKECKCHGVSGSCAIRTCWKILPSFRFIGDFIYKKYNKARLVVTEKEKNGLILVLKKWVFEDTCDKTLIEFPNCRKSKAVNAPKTIKPKELVYIQASPSYCERDLVNGAHGEFDLNFIKRTLIEFSQKPQERWAVFANARRTATKVVIYFVAAEDTTLINSTKRRSVGASFIGK